MNIFIYDSTFEGLMTSVYEAYYGPCRPDRIIADTGSFQENLLYNVIYIKTDIKKANRVLNAVEEKISPESRDRIYTAFLSELPEAGTLIYNYVRLGFKMGQQIELHQSNDYVLGIFNIERKVHFECHRLLGLLRFSQIGDSLYYAPMEPDHNVLRLVAPHFTARLSDQNWIIHDIRRNMAALYNQAECVYSPFKSESLPEILSPEDKYRSLWKSYFKNIAIQNRINPKLQKKNMPVRYWKYLVEKH